MFEATLYLGYGDICNHATNNAPGTDYLRQRMLGRVARVQATGSFKIDPQTEDTCNAGIFCFFLDLFKWLVGLLTLGLVKL